MIRVAVSILNHNSAQNTVACVQSLLSAEQVQGGQYQIDIIVSDNASNESDRHHLQQSLAQTPHVNLQMNHENLGFAAGHNHNLTAIFDRFDPDYVWVLNNDCEVYGGTLSSLIESSVRHPDVGIWGATLLDADGETIQCAGGCFYNSWISSYRQYGAGKKLAHIEALEDVEYDYIVGASLFAPVRTLQNGLEPLASLPVGHSTDKYQWLNEDFFLYFEELDLAQRLKPPFTMGWCKDALIKHVGGASTGTAENQRTAMAEYHSTLSALKFTRLYYPYRLWFMAPSRYFLKCLLLLVRGDVALIGPLSRAYRSFWNGRD